MDSKLFNYAKSPIPVINNSSPHNYAIMSALLSHIDSPLQSSPFQSNSLNLSNLTSSLKYSNPISNNREYQNMPTSFYYHNGVKLINHQQNNLLSSKEIIYTTKRLKLQNIDHGRCNNSNENSTQVILLNNENANSSSNSNMQGMIEDEVENEQDADIEQSTSQYDSLSSTNNSDFNTNFQILNSDLDTSSLINSASNSIDHNQSSVTISSNFLIETDSFVNDLNQSVHQSNGNQTVYSQIFNESQSNNINIIDDSQSYQGSQQAYEQEPIETSDQSLVTYTISCPSDWQYNLNRMINCFIMLNKLDKNSISSTQTINLNKIKLKCSVCKQEFFKLDDLLEHKEESDSCKNDVNIRLSSDEIEIKKSKRKSLKNIVRTGKLDITNGYFVDEDLEEEQFEFDYDEEEEEDENDVDVMEDLDDDLETLYLDGCDEDEVDDVQDEDDENELNKCNENGNSKKNTNKKKNDQYSNEFMFHNNELVPKVKLKNDVKFKLKNSTSSSSDFEKEDINEATSNNTKSSQARSDKQPVKARRKYTKSKANAIPSLTCEKCNKTCRTKAELLVHLHKHAGNDPECWECGKKCASFSNLVSHVQLHTGEKPYTCQFCGKQFTQDAHLTRHIRLHTGERPFVCNICGKNYKDYSYYKTHLRIHRGERLYKCNYCNKEYYDASYYKKHTRLHTGEKPYMCTVCGRQFHRSDYLKLHSYSHTDERPFNCHICGKGFKMNYNLKIHLKNHESQEQINQSSLMSSSNDETSSFNDTNQFNNAATGLAEAYNSHSSLDNNSLNINLEDDPNKTDNSIVTTNDFNTNEIVSFLIQDIELDLRNTQRVSKNRVKLISNSIDLDTNTIQIINSHHHHQNHMDNGLNDLDVSLLDEHQLSMVN